MTEDVSRTTPKKSEPLDDDARLVNHVPERDLREKSAKPFQNQGQTRKFGIPTFRVTVRVGLEIRLENKNGNVHKTLKVSCFPVTMTLFDVKCMVETDGFKKDCGFQDGSTMAKIQRDNGPLYGDITGPLKFKRLDSGKQLREIGISLRMEHVERPVDSGGKPSSGATIETSPGEMTVYGVVPGMMPGVMRVEIGQRLHLDNKVSDFWEKLKYSLDFAHREKSWAIVRVNRKDHPQGVVEPTLRDLWKQYSKFGELDEQGKTVLHIEINLDAQGCSPPRSHVDKEKDGQPNLGVVKFMWKHPTGDGVEMETRNLGTDITSLKQLTDEIEKCVGETFNLLLVHEKPGPSPKFVQLQFPRFKNAASFPNGEEHDRYREAVRRFHYDIVQRHFQGEDGSRSLSIVTCKCAPRI